MSKKSATPKKRIERKKRPETRPETRLVVAVSSRALFDLQQSHGIFETLGVDAYRKHQIQHEREKLAPGGAFDFIRKLMAVDRRIKAQGGIIEVVLLSRNSSDTGLRIFNSIRQHKLEISRAAFCGGETPHRYAKALGVDLFLSAEQADVEAALRDGTPAALLLPSSKVREGKEEDATLRIAFDGDAVLFSNESQKIYDKKGLEAFQEHEEEKADMPMTSGPFLSFLERLHQLQKLCRNFPLPPIRTALITARSRPAGDRVLHTLREWGILLDETIFVGGGSKRAFVDAFRADIFFDDTMAHSTDAADVTASGHVPDVAGQEADARGSLDLLEGLDPSVSDHVPDVVDGAGTQ